jgi:hypothetical protein
LPAYGGDFGSRGCIVGNTIEPLRAVDGDHFYLSTNDRWRGDVAAPLGQ